MALVDSESAFKKRCDQLQAGLAEKAEAQNLTTFSTFAFSAGSPQNQVSDAEINKLAESIYGTPTLGDVATIRRLHFESCTYLLNDMKTSASNTDASEPLKKLPFVEKQTRLEAQKKRITGLLHKPDQQPAYSLIDLAFHIIETGALTYIGPSKCHSREMEIQSESKQKSKQIITIEQGSLKSSVSSALSDVDTSTELRLFFALQRRHLGFELVHLLPLDEIFMRLMHDPRVNVHLIAMPRVQPGIGNPSLKGPKRELDSTGGAPKGQPPKKPKFNDREPAKIPDELKGLKLRTSEGKPMCWHFNLSKGCNNQTKNGRCKFGYHTCMRCLKPKHGASACHSNAAS